MKRLNTQQLIEMERLGALVRKKQAELSHAIDQANSTLAERWEAFRTIIDCETESVKAAIANYNGVVREIAEFVAETIEDQEASIEAKSERWQESPAGLAAEDWKANWVDFEADELFEFELEMEFGGYAEVPIDPPQFATYTEEDGGVLAFWELPQSVEERR